MPKRKRAKGKIVLGLTGSFGSGKSTVAAILKSFGAEVIDADKLARDCLRPRTECYRRVRKVFGQKALKADGSIDRKVLAGLVFNNRSLLFELNRIIHPRVRRLIREKIGRAKKRIVVLDAPLLIEAGLGAIVDKLIVVGLCRSAQVKRLQKKFGLKESEIFKRISAQIPLREKMRLADFIIDNNGRIDQTKKQVRKIWIKEEAEWKN
ncbi:MAG: dephospho-CoA kinase [Omnitrophica WOR_2 bacterium RIFCSPLOWO2_12_FULL_51_8]|nr:MAG: dephospho-CoA kinase [Omnitrophica WOR_2 bacterium RIFCSPLOWO2_12_FULL_51_8]